MRGYRNNRLEGKEIFAGIDLHRKMWHVTVPAEDEDIFKGSMPGNWEALQKLPDRYRGCNVVYEAGYFWLHDQLAEYGAECIVTPQGED